MFLKAVAKKLYRSLPTLPQSRIDAWRQRGTLTRGKGSFVHGTVHILGRNYVRVGPATCISEGVWLNVNHRDGNDFRIDIGAHCFIGKRNFFSSGHLIKFGDYCLTAVDAKFLGSAHEIGDPYVPHLFSGTTRTDNIVLGANCFVGAGATVVGNVSIGHGCVLGAGALVTCDLPPFSVALGVPAKVVKRYSFSAMRWVPVNEFSEADERQLPAESEYLAALHGRFRSSIMPLVACGKSMGDI